MHGGDIYHRQVHIDFSVNTNPLGVPSGVKEAIFSAIDDVEQYPQLYNKELCQKIAQYWSRKGLEVSGKQILCGNGASELICAIARGIQVKKALLLAPSFTGYEAALDAVKAEKMYFYLNPSNDFLLENHIAKELLETLENKGSDIDLCIITNPNNPNGALVSRKEMEQIQRICEEKGIYLLVDECFMALTGKSAEYSLLESGYSLRKHTIVLRAFTKSMAVAGLRLGYAVFSDEDLASKILLELPEWNVSVFAQRAGLAALKEDVFLHDSCKFIAKERKVLQEVLQKYGLYVFKSDSNHLLFYTGEFEKMLENADNLVKTDLQENLLDYGILIRDCRDYEGLAPGFYRVAVKNRECIEALDEALSKIFENAN